jgi:hypothetical protein
MLGMIQQQINQCVTFMGDTPNTRIKRKRIKIIDTVKNDFFEQLFLTEKITPEHWQLITDIRRLAFQARRSQGIRVRLQSHSQHWGMPLVFADDGYTSPRAERRWKLFVYYLKPLTDHQWLDKQLLELLLFGGHILSEDEVMGRPSQSDFTQTGFTIDAVHHMLLVIQYVYEKAHRRR